MGLLDTGIEDPTTAGLLSLGLRLMSTPGKFGTALGQAGLGALQDVNATKAANQARQSQALQQQMAALQLQQAQAQAAKQASIEDAIKNARLTPQQVAMQQNGGPTVAAANAAPTSAPGFDWQKYQGALTQIDPMAGLQLQQALQKDDTPIKLGADETLYSGKASGYKQLAKGAPKEDDFIKNLSKLYPAGSPQYNAALADWLKTKSTHPAPVSVHVSMDKGFGETFAKDAAQSLGTSRDQARSAAGSIRTLDSITQILDTGKVAVGPTSKFEQFGRQLGELSGIGGKDNAEVLGNTRKLITNAAALSVDGAQALAKQGQITDGERLLIARASGGNIDSLTAPEIRALTAALRKVATFTIQQHNEMLDNVDPKFQQFSKFYRVNAPQAPQPLIRQPAAPAIPDAPQPTNVLRFDAQGNPIGN